MSKPTDPGPLIKQPQTVYLAGALCPECLTENLYAVSSDLPARDIDHPQRKVYLTLECTACYHRLFGKVLDRA